MFLLLTLNIFKPFSSVSIVDFEQANVSWALATPIHSQILIKINPFLGNFPILYPPLENTRKPKLHCPEMDKNAKEYERFSCQTYLGKYLFPLKNQETFGEVFLLNEF